MEAALRIDPKAAKAHNNLGIALVAVGRREEGVESFRRALQYIPNSASAHENLSKALRLLGRTQEAETEADIARRLR